METTSRTFYYARVSDKGQVLDRQIEAFMKLGASDRDIITDKESGKSLERPGYNALKSSLLRRGDTLVIKSLDRLSRKKADIKKELEYFKAEGIRIKILDLPTSMIEMPEGNEWVFDMVNNILIEVMGTIAEQERITLLHRQREGIDVMVRDDKGRSISKKKGVVYGRKPTALPENFDDMVREWQRGEMTAAEVMRKSGVAKTTFYRRIKELYPDAELKATPFSDRSKAAGGES